MREPRRRVGGWTVAAVLAVLAIFLYSVRLALLPFLVAAAIAFVADPAILWLAQRLRLPRRLAAVLACIAFMAVLAAAGWRLLSLLVRQGSEMAADAPGILHRAIVQILGGESLHLLGQRLDADTLTAQALDALHGFLAGSELATLAAGGAAAVAALVLTLVLVFYFFLSGPQIAASLLWLVPPEYRAEVETVVRRVAPVLRRYIVGLAVIVAYASLVAWIGFGPVFALPHALALAIVVGFLELVPILGPVAALALVGLTAVQQGSLWAIAGLALLAIGLRLSIDQLVGPLVLGQAASLHPVAVMFAFLTGAVLFGVVGLLIAVPVAATIKIALAHYYAEPIAGTGE